MSLFIPPNVVLSGAKWYFYATGTTTPATVYTTSARNVAHSNPVVADSSGRFASIYLDPAVVYRAVLQTSAGPTLCDVDPFDQSATQSDLASGDAAGRLGYIAGGTEAVARTVQAKLREIEVSPLDYGCVGDGSDEPTNFQKFLTALANGARKGIIPAGFDFGISGHLGIPNGAWLEGRGGTITAKADGTSLIMYANLNDCRIEGLIFDKAGTTDPAIWAYNPQRIDIINNRITNCTANGGIECRSYPAAYGGDQDTDGVYIAGNYVEGIGAPDGAFGICVDGLLPQPPAASVQATWNASPGTVVTSTYAVKNFRIIGNEIVGFYYGISTFSGQNGVISNNILRDDGGGFAAPTGPRRGIVAQCGCKNLIIANNYIQNAQSSSILLNYGGSDITVIGNRIYNEIYDYGTDETNSIVDGSQAPIQAQLGITDTLVALNEMVVPSTGRGPEYAINIGPHCADIRVLYNSYKGKVAKSGIHVESTYDTTSAISNSLTTSFAADSDGGSSLAYVGTQWGTAALTDISIIGNTISLTGAKPGIDVIQATTINITRLVVRDNYPKGSATAFASHVVSGAITYDTARTQGLTNAADDTAAATAGVPVGGEYRNGSVKMVRVS